MSQTFSYDSLHFYDYLSGGNSNSHNLWQTNNASIQNSLISPHPLSTNGAVERKYFHAGLASLCRQYLNVDLASIEYPGGSQRSSFRLILKNGQSLIASRREEVGRGVLEERVLHHLDKQDAPVPKLLAFNGLVLFQEDVGDQRLSAAFEGVDERHFENLAAKAIESLLNIHQAAELENLDSYVPILGHDHDWLIAFMDRPALLGNYLNLAAPVPDLDNIYDLLTLLIPRFVKWDARPGNAIVNKQQEIIWFDWEHCGARNRLDDLVWLLCDENTPYFPNTENSLLHKYIHHFQDSFSLEHAYSYCRVFGVLHCCTRLTLILSEKEEDGWGDHQRILEGDKVGVTLEQAQRLCQRVAGWCEQEPLVENLSEWLLEVSDCLSEL